MKTLLKMSMGWWREAGIVGSGTYGRIVKKPHHRPPK